MVHGDPVHRADGEVALEGSTVQRPELRLSERVRVVGFPREPRPTVAHLLAAVARERAHAVRPLQGRGREVQRQASRRLIDALGLEDGVCDARERGGDFVRRGHVHHLEPRAQRLRGVDRVRAVGRDARRPREAGVRGHARDVPPRQTREDREARDSAGEEHPDGAPAIARLPRRGSHRRQQRFRQSLRRLQQPLARPRGRAGLLGEPKRELERFRLSVLFRGQVVVPRAGRGFDLEARGDEQRRGDDGQKPRLVGRRRPPARRRRRRRVVDRARLAVDADDVPRVVQVPPVVRQVRPRAPGVRGGREEPIAKRRRLRVVRGRRPLRGDVPALLPRLLELVVADAMAQHGLAPERVGSDVTRAVDAAREHPERAAVLRDADEVRHHVHPAVLREPFRLHRRALRLALEPQDLVVHLVPVVPVHHPAAHEHGLEAGGREVRLDLVPGEVHVVLLRALLLRPKRARPGGRGEARAPASARRGDEDRVLERDLEEHHRGRAGKCARGRAPARARVRRERGGRWSKRRRLV